MNPLREFRQTTGLSQDRMARRMGVSMSMYEKVERGFAKPSRGFMEKLKEQFPDASIDEIFFSQYKDIDENGTKAEEESM